MIKDKYLNEIKEKIHQFSQGKDTKFFLFGSCLHKNHFGDIDLGFLGKINKQELIKLKETFTDSTLPFFIDIVNFNNINREFKNNVFNNKIIWIKP